MPLDETSDEKKTALMALARLEALGARRVDVGQADDVTWVVLADPHGNEFCILRAFTTEEMTRFAADDAAR